MKPGHPAGAWQAGSPRPGENPPSERDLRDIFDEATRAGDLSESAWVMLRRLAEAMDGEPDKLGTLVIRPDPDEFFPDPIWHLLSPEREEALRKGDVPTNDEASLFQKVMMEEAASGEGPFCNRVLGWWIHDDQARKRFMATLYGDHATFERVAGLYRDPDAAAEDLSRCGVFEWDW